MPPVLSPSSILPPHSRKEKFGTTLQQFYQLLFSCFIKIARVRNCVTWTSVSWGLFVPRIAPPPPSFPTDLCVPFELKRTQNSISGQNWALLPLSSISQQTQQILKHKRPTWCHLLFYFTSYVPNMFRILIYPSSGACDYSVELPHWSYCSWFYVCWSFGVVGLEWYPCCRLQPCIQIPNKIPSYNKTN